MKLFVISHCNKWHEYSSFKLIGVVDEENLDDALLKIKTKLVYSDEEMEDYIHIEEIVLNDLDI